MVWQHNPLTTGNVGDVTQLCMQLCAENLNIRLVIKLEMPNLRINLIL